MSVNDTKKSLTLIAYDKFGRYSVNEFFKKTLRLAIDCPDFFFDVLTGVINIGYDKDTPLNSEFFSRIRENVR